HDPDLYVTERIEAKAADGEDVPVVLLRRKDVDRNGDRPVVLYGYGSYGIYIEDGFSTSVLSLVDRGVIYAVAHIRGGSAKGRRWYLDGKREKKINTFTDFNAAANALIAEGYTRRGRIVAYGGSAGGLLVGAAVNLDPSLYGGIIGAVPFVDVVSTIADDTLPLTPPEWEEWGNPITDDEAYRTIKSYSPYDNIKPGETYPPVLATGGLTDYRVTYWEPAKWIARLREEAKGGPFLLRMNMSAGHGGSAARFERLKERASDYAFALDVLKAGG
ncbi:MAG: prolyl oligopeptidase family serine peptidase, partial [Parvularcula sp.]|nr:prolyl oligopeptidase family serine peptidase [Parvularcula sp.]